MNKKTKKKKSASPESPKLEVGQTVMLPIAGEGVGVSLQPEIKDARDAINALETSSPPTFNPSYFCIPPGDYVLVPRAHYEQCYAAWKRLNHLHHYGCTPAEMEASIIQQSLGRVVRKPVEKPVPSDDQIKLDIHKLAKEMPQLDALIQTVEAEVKSKQKGKDEPANKPEGTQGS